MAARVALTALQVIVDENLVENSYKLGQLLRHELQTIQSRIVTEVSARACLALMPMLASVQLVLIGLPSLPGRNPQSACPGGIPRLHCTGLAIASDQMLLEAGTGRRL